jgi:hypothetical protein
MAVQVAMEHKAGSGNVQYLPYDVKRMFEDALRELKSKISKLAVAFYRNNEFEVTSQIIPLMRDVVEYGI